MGMFDYLSFEYQLPTEISFLQNEEFQTKDFENGMMHFVVTAEGELKVRLEDKVELPEPVDHGGWLGLQTHQGLGTYTLHPFSLYGDEIKIHGIYQVYSYNEKTKQFYYLLLKFTNGILESIRYSGQDFRRRDLYWDGW